jgi:hypothetical protein
MDQGAIHLMANPQKLIAVILLTLLVTGCSEFALLMSSGSIAVSQNAYVKAYNGVDVLTIMSTDKDIKNHIYEKSRTYINSASKKFSRTH